MNDRRFTLADGATVGVVASLCVAAVWMAMHGPNGAIPVHFDLSGRADRYGGRNEVAGIFGILAAIAALSAGGLGWYAVRSGDPARRRGLRLGQWVTLLAIAGVGLFAGARMLSGFDFETTGGWATAGLGLILILIGAFLGRVGPNPVVGVRTPWSFKSRLAWDRSNRLAGRLFFWLGLTAVVSGPFLPTAQGMPVLITGILITAALSVVESWRVWRSDPDRQPF